MRTSVIFNGLHFKLGSTWVIVPRVYKVPPPPPFDLEMQWALYLLMFLISKNGLFYYNDRDEVSMNN